MEPSRISYLGRTKILWVGGYFVEVCLQITRLKTDEKMTKNLIL